MVQILLDAMQADLLLYMQATGTGHPKDACRMHAQPAAIKREKHGPEVTSRFWQSNTTKSRCSCSSVSPKIKAQSAAKHIDLVDDNELFPPFQNRRWIKVDRGNSVRVSQYKNRRAARENDFNCSEEEHPLRRMNFYCNSSERCFFCESKDAVASSEAANRSNNSTKTDDEFHADSTERIDDGVS